MAVLCCGLMKNGMVRAWHGHGMASLNQTQPHCVNQMEKRHSKPLAARHGRGTVWARHALCESAFSGYIWLKIGTYGRLCICIEEPLRYIIHRLRLL